MDKHELEKELEKLLERQQQIQADYDYVRDALYLFIEDGKKKLERLGEVCEGSDHPRAFEVYFKGNKDLCDACDKFLEHQRKKQIVDSDTTMEIIRLREQHGIDENVIEAHVVEDKPMVTNKFYGGTAELQKLLQQHSKANA